MTDMKHPTSHAADPKHPDVIEGTPQEKLTLAKNTAALRPRQTLYVKIRANCAVEADKSASILAAVDAFEAACEAADVEFTQCDVELTPPSEGEPKRAEAKREKAARKAAKREADAKHEAEQRAHAAPR